MNKRIIVTVLASCLVFAALAAPAQAGKKKKKPPVKTERTATSDYQAPAIGTPETPSVCLRPTNSCGDIAMGAGELYAKIEISDSSGTATAFSFGQDTDPAALGTETTYGMFCGTTGETAIQVQEGFPLVVFPYVLGGALCPGAIGTAGTITATISNLP